MFLYLPFVFFSGLCFLLLNCNIFFFDEEFLVGLCLLILYAFLFQALRRFLRFIFFHKVDFVYFYFFFLLKLLVFFYESIVALLQFFFLQYSLFFTLQLTFFTAYWLVRFLAQLCEGLSLEFFFGGFFFHSFLHYLGFCIHSAWELSSRQNFLYDEALLDVFEGEEDACLDVSCAKEENLSLDTLPLLASFFAGLPKELLA